MKEWNNEWYNNPQTEAQHLAMTRYIYQHYNNTVVRIMPPRQLDKLKKFIDTNNCSDIRYAQFLHISGIIRNKEIGRRVYHWLTCEVIE